MQTNRKKTHVFIVDRDIACAESLRQELVEAGYFVRILADIEDAIAAIKERTPHLVIIDWNMPGLQLIQSVQRMRTPVRGRMIILSALSSELDVVNGLNLGADDYIVKPFSAREMIARVSAVLRSRRLDESRGKLAFDDLVLDAATQRVTARGRPLSLRGIEYRLLEFLMVHQGRTLNRHQLLTHVWGDDATIDERTVDVNVQRLRRVLEGPGYESYLQTIRGYGYRFAVPIEPR